MILSCQVAFKHESEILHQQEKTSDNTLIGNDKNLSPHFSSNQPIFWKSAFRTHYLQLSFFFLSYTNISLLSMTHHDLEHEERQNKFRALRNRQDLFQEEGILNLILEAIDKINIMTSQGFMVTLASDESGQNLSLIHISEPTRPY